MAYIVKQIGRNTKIIDLPTELLSQRIIFLDTDIDDDISSEIIQQLMWLASENKQDIDLYIQSRGGSVTAGLAIKDTIDILKTRGIKVNTIGIGLVASMGSYLLSCGTGVRKASKSCRIMIHSVSSYAEGKIEDMKVNFEEANKLNNLLKEDYITFSKNKLDKEKIDNLFKIDSYMSSQEYLNLNLIDIII